MARTTGPSGAFDVNWRQDGSGEADARPGADDRRWIPRRVREPYHPIEQQYQKPDITYRYKHSSFYLRGRLDADILGLFLVHSVTVPKKILRIFNFFHTEKII
eukprot:630655-Amphidinium_carterae.1